jgi:hypothetical protein
MKLSPPALLARLEAAAREISGRERIFLWLAIRRLERRLQASLTAEGLSLRLRTDTNDHAAR